MLALTLLIGISFRNTCIIFRETIEQKSKRRTVENRRPNPFACSEKGDSCKALCPEFKPLHYMLRHLYGGED